MPLSSEFKIETTAFSSTFDDERLDTQSRKRRLCLCAGASSDRGERLSEARRCPIVPRVSVPVKASTHAVRDSGRAPVPKREHQPPVTYRCEPQALGRRGMGTPEGKN